MWTWIARASVIVSVIWGVRELVVDSAHDADLQVDGQVLPLSRPAGATSHLWLWCPPQMDSLIAYVPPGISRQEVIAAVRQYYDSLSTRYHLRSEYAYYSECIELALHNVGRSSAADVRIQTTAPGYYEVTGPGPVVRMGAFEDVIVVGSILAGESCKLKVWMSSYSAIRNPDDLTHVFCDGRRVWCDYRSEIPLGPAWYLRAYGPTVIPYLAAMALIGWVGGWGAWRLAQLLAGRAADHW